MSPSAQAPAQVATGKPELDEVEKAVKFYDDEDLIAPTAEEKAAYIRKLDFHIMPVIFLIYMLSVLVSSPTQILHSACPEKKTFNSSDILCGIQDRSNLGNAHQAGLDDGIGLVGNQYNLLGTIFYIGCELFPAFRLTCKSRHSTEVTLNKTSSLVPGKLEVTYRCCKTADTRLLSTDILSMWTVAGWKAFPAHIWCALVVFAWSSLSSLQSSVQNFSGLAAIRFFLGIFEAMYAGVPVYLSFFYPRDKIGFRQGLFISGSALANAYGGALGYAVRTLAPLFLFLYQTLTLQY